MTVTISTLIISNRMKITAGWTSVNTTRVTSTRTNNSSNKEVEVVEVVVNNATNNKDTIMTQIIKIDRVAVEMVVIGSAEEVLAEETSNLITMKIDRKLEMITILGGEEVAEVIISSCATISRTARQWAAITAIVPPQTLATKTRALGISAEELVTSKNLERLEVVKETREVEAPAITQS